MNLTCRPVNDDKATRLPAGRKADLAAHVAEVGEVTVSALASRFRVLPTRSDGTWTNWTLKACWSGHTGEP